VGTNANEKYPGKKKILKKEKKIFLNFFVTPKLQK
jgi:hypothetical protein